MSNHQFLCNLCSKKFSNQNNMYRHRKHSCPNRLSLTQSNQQNTKLQNIHNINSVLCTEHEIMSFPMEEGSNITDLIVKLLLKSINSINMVSKKIDSLEKTITEIKQILNMPINNLPVQNDTQDNIQVYIEKFNQGYSYEQLTMLIS